MTLVILVEVRQGRTVNAFGTKTRWAKVGEEIVTDRKAVPAPTVSPRAPIKARLASKN